MLTILAHPYSILLARLALGVVFLVSGLGKVFQREQTISDVIAYDILPRPLARVYGTLLPWGELTLATLLFLGLWTQLAALALGLLLMSFAIAVSANLIRGRDMSCGCFGSVAKEKLGWPTLGRIVVLLALASGVATWAEGHFAIDGVLASGGLEYVQWPPWIDFWPVLVTATLLLLAYRLLIQANQVIADHRHLKVDLEDHFKEKLETIV